jgi:hypothetical protein
MPKKRKFAGMPPPARKGEVNYSWFDRFTFIHFGIGVAYAVFGLSAGAALGLAILWEVVENPLKANVPFIFPHATADTWKNMAGDILAVLSGWLLFHGGTCIQSNWH